MPSMKVHRSAMSQDTSLLRVIPRGQGTWALTPSRRRRQVTDLTPRLEGRSAFRKSLPQSGQNAFNEDGYRGRPVTGGASRASMTERLLVLEQVQWSSGLWTESRVGISLRALSGCGVAGRRHLVGEGWRPCARITRRRSAGIDQCRLDRWETHLRFRNIEVRRRMNESPDLTASNSRAR